ncbi:MAG: hypothetical protein ABEI31_02470 [Halodesulfurarchaeum sp.]
MASSPGEDEWICRRCGQVNDKTVSVCPNCDTPSTRRQGPAPRAGSPRTGRDLLDWTTIAVILLVATAIVLLAYLAGLQ